MEQHNSEQPRHGDLSDQREAEGLEPDDQTEEHTADTSVHESEVDSQGARYRLNSMTDDIKQSIDQVKS